jgi:hypothetical protein
MDRAELAALRDAIDLLLKCPDAVCEQLAKWFLPNAAKPGNGLDPHSPPIAATKSPEDSSGLSPRRPPYMGKSKRGRPKASAKTAERKLVEAMAQNPNMSVIGLANAAGSSRSATGERLRQMALRGVVTKDTTGRWKLKSEEPRLPDPPQPSPS